MSLAEHRHRTPRVAHVWVATLSDTRTGATDDGGATIRSLLEQSGHEIVGSSILREDDDTLPRELRQLVSNAKADVLICTGGTGIAPRDIAYEHLQRLYDRAIPGFGELFRLLSWQEIGSAALLSRASAGISSGVLIFSVPGSPAAIELALTKLILPELPHLLSELHRGDTPEAPS